MKSLLVLATGITFCLANTAKAQFYAPPTEFHDISQRMFVIELVRVLGWQAGHAQKSVTAVPETDPLGGMVWKVTMSDSGAAGDGKKEFQVKYDGDLTVLGPKFYREIFQQVSNEISVTEGVKQSATEAIGAYWEGAELAGPSRAHTAMLIGEVAGKAPLSVGSGMRLAGLLTHGSLPKVAGQHTLDALWLARSAAWLALAEKSLGKPLPDAIWAPLLHACGREPIATTLWGLAPSDFPKTSPAAKGWSLLMKKPSAREAYLAVANEDYGSLAMPLLAYYWLENSQWTARTLEHTKALLPAGARAKAFDYAPMLMEKGGMATGHSCSGDADAALQAWVEAFEKLAPADAKGYAGDFTDAEVGSIKTALGAWKGLDLDEAEIADITQAVSGFFRLGLEGGQKVPLRSTAGLTLWDWLVYGWESGCIQRSSRCWWLHESLGDKEASAELDQACTKAWPGAEVFFPQTDPKAEKRAGQEPKETTSHRLSFLTEQVCTNRSHQELSKKSKTPGESANVAFRRAWLHPHKGSRLLDIAFHRGATESDMNFDFKRWLDEGGTLEARSLLYTWNGSSVGTFYGREDRYQFIREKAARGSSGASVASYFELGRTDGKWLEAAQAAEKAAWETESSDMGSAATRLYIRAGAFDDAKRFYREFRHLYTNSVALSNIEYPRLWMTAWLDNDREFMKSIAEDGSTYSFSDLEMQAISALLSGNLEKCGQILDAQEERYTDAGSRKVNGYFKSLLKAVPILKDRKHAEFKASLDVLSKTTRYSGVRWLVARQLKLTEEETRSFLGGSSMGGEPQLYFALLDKNEEDFKEKLDHPELKLAKESEALVIAEAIRVFKWVRPSKRSSLRPQDFKSFGEAMAVAAAKKSGQLAKDALKLSGKETAEELWKKLQGLRDKKAISERLKLLGQKPDLKKVQEEVSKMLSETEFVANALVEKHPDSPRRWDAEIAIFESHLAVQRTQRNAPEPDRSRLEKLIASADASVESKETASILLLTHMMRKSEDEGAKLKVVVSWLDEFTDSSRRPEVEGMLLYLVSEDESEAATKHLELLAKSKDKDIAGEAKSLLDSRKFLSTLRTTPLELTFTDLEGAKVDCSKLRGSVVLLDFWASESQQCLDAMPSLVKLHKAHGDKTLKIIGINLDKDKSDAKFAAAQHGLSWPHHHDGEQENGFAAKFQIESTPSVWLFDKKGKLREVGLEGEELTEAVEKLLKE